MMLDFLVQKEKVDHVVHRELGVNLVNVDNLETKAQRVKEETGVLTEGEVRLVLKEKW